MKLWDQEYLRRREVLLPAVVEEGGTGRSGEVVVTKERNSEVRVHTST